MRRICTISWSPIKVARSSTDSIARLGAPARDFELVIVRHGRTAWNAGGRYQGHTDIPLDDVGREQAAELARALSEREFDVAFASDLARARETAQIVLGARAALLTLDPRWREMNFGAWEGLTRAEILARKPGAEAATAPRFMTPEGGETFAQLCERIGAALETIAERTPNGGRALVATHAGPLHAALRALLGEREATELAVKFLPASYTSFALGPGGPRLLALNRTPWESAAAGNGGGSG